MDSLSAYTSMHLYGVDFTSVHPLPTLHQCDTCVIPAKVGAAVGHGDSVKIRGAGEDAGYFYAQILCVAPLCESG